MPKPVAPSPALRSDPANFSANAEAQLLYIPEAVDFVDEQAEIAQAAALAGDLPDLTGRALTLLQVNSAEDGLQFYGIPDGGSALIPTTSGSAVTQAIPAGVQEITIIFKGAGWTSTTETVVRVGPSSTPVATGYDSDMVTINASVTSITLGSTIGFAAGVWGAADVTKGSMTLRREVAGANDWSMEANIFTSTEVYKTYGTVSLAGELDIVQLTNNSGGATLDGGGIIVRWR